MRPQTAEKMILNERIKQCVKETKEYKEHLNAAYGYVWGQCTEGLKNQLQSRKDWNEIKTKHHPVTIVEGHQRAHSELSGFQVSHEEHCRFIDECV